MNIDITALKIKEKEFRDLTEAEIKEACHNYKEHETFKDRVFTMLLSEFLNSEKSVIFNETEMLESYRFIRDLLIGGAPKVFSTVDLQVLPDDL